MQTTATSVVSAAVIGGDLILGLGDGSIINCGRVQGPQGLKGDQGPMGATGRPGTDGNTIHTVAGAPDTTLGKDGDFAINTVVWEIYGPRSGGVWGTGTPLRGNKRGDRESKDPIFGMGSGEDGSGGGKAYNTANLPLAGTGRAHTAPGGNIIPIGNNLVFQSNLNRWIIDSLTALDEALPVSVGDVLPDEGEYQGDLFLKDGTLYVYAKEGWLAVGGDAGPPVYVGEAEPPGSPQTGELWYCTDEKYLTLFVYTGTTWVVASPPVSLDGIESSITNIEGDLIELHNNVRDVKGDVVLTNQDLQALVQDQERQDLQIVELEEEIEALAPTFDRGKWAFVEGDSIGAGEYGMGLGVDSTYCQEKYLECLAEAGDDEVAKTACNRQMGECEAASTEGDGEFYINDWAHAAFLHFHKLDAEGTNHTFGDCEVGQYIDLFDQEDDNYALFEVTEAPIQEGDVYKIGVLPIQHQGEAEGLARIKVFELAGADPTEYVRKSGDTMTGKLVVAPDSGSSPSVELKPAPDAPDARGVIFTRDKNGQLSFLVAADGSPRAGKDEGSPFMAKVDWDLTTKKYVDKYLKTKIGRDYIWTLGNAGPWELRQNDSSDQEQKFIEIFDGKMNLRNVDTPASEGDAATKGYVDHAVANITAGVYGSPYRYRKADQKAEKLEPGEFFISSNQSLYAHPKDALGRDTMFTEANFYPHRAYKGFLKVYYSNGDLKHALEFSEIITGNSSNNYVKWLENITFKKSPVWYDQIYYLADGFILPF